MKTRNLFIWSFIASLLLLVLLPGGMTSARAALQSQKTLNNADTAAARVPFSDFSAAGNPATPQRASSSLPRQQSGAPTLSEVSPVEGTNNVTTTITLVGGNFSVTGAPTVTLGVTPLLNVRVLSPTVLIADVPMSTTLGTYNVTVSNPGGQSATLANAFSVVNFDASTVDVEIYHVPHPYVLDIIYASDGNIWGTAGTDDTRIYKLNLSQVVSGTSNGVEVYYEPYSGGTPSTMVEDNNGHICWTQEWFRGAGGGRIGCLTMTQVVSGTSNGVAEFPVTGSWRDTDGITFDSTTNSFWFSQRNDDKIVKMVFSETVSGTSNGLYDHNLPGGAAWPNGKTPYQITADGQGNVWILGRRSTGGSDINDTQVWKLALSESSPGTPNGFYAYQMPDYNPDYSTANQDSIKLSPDGTLWATTDRNLYRIIPTELVTGTSQGIYVYHFPGKKSNLPDDQRSGEIQFDSSNQVWLTDYATHKIISLDPTKAISGTSRGFTEYPLPFAIAPYSKTAMDNNDNLYFAGQLADNTPVIAKFTPPAQQDAINLTFDACIPGTIQDVNGCGTGFTHRLPDTGGNIPIADANLNMSIYPERLTITSTHSDINCGGVNLAIDETPGVKLSRIGTKNFSVSALFRDVHVSEASDQLLLYIATDANHVFRAGMHGPPSYMLVQSLNGSDFGNQYVGTFNQGDDIQVTIERAGVSSYTVTYTNLTNPVNSASDTVTFHWLDAASDLYVGVLYFNNACKTLNNPKTSQIDEFNVTVNTPMLTIEPPARATTGNRVSVPIHLNHITASDDLRGLQFSLRVSDSGVLSPATTLSPTMGDFFPGNSITAVTAASGGWDFLLTAPLSPTAAASGSGTVITLPFTAQSAGCVDLSFTDHRLSNGNAQPVSHTAGTAKVCVEDTGSISGSIYLDWRKEGHYTGTQLTLTGATATYTATAAPRGGFSFTGITAGNYTLQANRDLFVRAVRALTVSAGTTLTARIGLWAGDINQDQDVTLYDWALLSAAIYPVADPAFDINDDGSTDIYDLMRLEKNRGQPDMTVTNPPARSARRFDSAEVKAVDGASAGLLALVPQDNGEILLRLETCKSPVQAVGARVTLPAGVNVNEIVLNKSVTGGFLKWHQQGDSLYIVAASPAGQTIAQGDDVLTIRGASEASMTAQNVVSPRELKVYLPLVMR